jgi:hypothetical protein
VRLACAISAARAPHAANHRPAIQMQTRPVSLRGS